MPLQTRISVISLYVVLLGSLVVIPLNLRADLQNGLIELVLAQFVFFILIVAATVSFWVTRTLVATRWLISVGVFAIATYLIIGSGGVRGLGLLYLVAGYPVLYHLVGYYSGVGLPVYIFVGTAVRHAFGNHHPASYFNDPSFVPLYLALLGVSAAVAVVSVVYQRRMLRSLSAAPYTDTVTGLPNRRRFEEQLDAIVSRREPYAGGFSVLAVRLRKFSQVNSFHGTTRGDEILAKLAERMRQECPPSSTIARFTGTMFMVLTTYHKIEEVEAFARSLHAAVQRTFTLGNDTATLRAQIAATRFPEDAGDAAQLVANVTTMVSRMDDSDRTVSLFNEVSFMAEKQQHHLTEQLRGALERNEFSLVYHPRVRVSDGSVLGAEVLLRWNSPRHGPVSPGLFIPLAEESGIVQSITRWVLDRSASELAQIREHYPNLVHSVNLSPLDLASPEFTRWVREWMEKRRVSPSAFEFEVTEGIAIDRNPRVHDSLNWLRRQGFGLAVDDFGTGYSNLRYLTELNLTTLKIDQSFVRMIPEDHDGDSLLAAIISLGHALKLDVTAEGVETDLQAQYLLRVGCSLGQGFLYHQPLTLRQYQEALDRGA